MEIVRRTAGSKTILAGMAALALGAAGVGVGVAYAAGVLAPGPDNTYVGCVAPKSGALSIVSSSSQCPKPDSVIALSGPIDRTVSVDCSIPGQSIQSAIDSAPTSL